MHSTRVSFSQRAMRREQRAMKHAVGVLVFLPSQSKFSSCGGVPRSGEVVFFYICSTLRPRKTTPALRATPPPEGNSARFFTFVIPAFVHPRNSSIPRGPGRGVHAVDGAVVCIGPCGAMDPGLRRGDDLKIIFRRKMNYVRRKKLKNLSFLLRVPE